MGKYIIMAAILGLSLLIGHGDAQATGVECSHTCGSPGNYYQIMCTCSSCAGDGVNCNCGAGCGSSLSGNPKHTGNVAFNPLLNNNPPSSPVRTMTIDPALAEQRNEAILNYIFRDRRLATESDFKKLGYGSRQDMLSDFKEKEQIVHERLYILMNFFRNPKLDISKIDFAGLGFASVDELRIWFNNISGTAFRTYGNPNPF